MDSGDYAEWFRHTVSSIDGFIDVRWPIFPSFTCGQLPKSRQSATEEIHDPETFPWRGVMSVATKNQRISKDAALLAVHWKSVFAEELQRLAQAAAGDSETVTADDYHCALPEAVQVLLDTVRIETTPSHAAKEAA